MPIMRVAYRHKPYSQLGNPMLRDVRLSPEATGVLVFILSHPADWQFNLEWLQDARRISRRLAQRVMRELRAAGYCRRHRGKRPDGTWQPYEYLFTDEPGAPLETPRDQNAPMVHKPRDQNPRCGKRTSTKKGTPKEEDTRKRISTSLGGSDGRVAAATENPLASMWGAEA